MNRHLRQVNRGKKDLETNRQTQEQKQERTEDKEGSAKVCFQFFFKTLIALKASILIFDC